MTMFKKIFLTLYSIILLVAVLAPATANALPLSYYSPNSALSQGKWVKIKVVKSGMYEISYDRLRELGFSDPASVAVYGYSPVVIAGYTFGEDIPEDLPPVAMMRTNDKIVFYAVGTESPVTYLNDTTVPYKYKVTFNRALESDAAYYYLTDSRPSASPEVSDLPPSSYYANDMIETAQGLVWQNFAERQPMLVGAYLFSKSLTDGGPGSIDFWLPEYTRSANTNPVFTYAMGVKARSPRFDVTLNGGSLVQLSMSSYGSDPSHLAYRYRDGICSFSGVAVADDEMYNVKFDYSRSDDPQDLAFDYYAMSYPRFTRLRAPQEYMAFGQLSRGQVVKLLDAPAGVKVWDVTTPLAPRELAVKAVDAAGSLGFVSDRGVRVSTTVPAIQTIVFNPAETLGQVEVVEESVANQDYHSMEIPDMVIVAVDNTMEQARRLADLHARYTGVNCAVVPYAEICNEFASGAVHPMAIRRFLKMLYDREPGKLKAVLLFARASSDNTGLSLPLSRKEFLGTYIPMMECQQPTLAGEVTRSYATDVIYTLLNDNFIPDMETSLPGHFYTSTMDINVGRIPALNSEEARVYVDKVEKYLTQPMSRPVYNRAMMLSDWGDGNLHLNQTEALRTMVKENSPTTVVDMLAQSLYDPAGGSNEKMRRRMIQLMQRGCGVFTFIGHASMKIKIGSGELWSSVDDKAAVTDFPSFSVFGTCESLILDASTPSLQTDMILNPTGGSIVAIGPMRPVFAQYNHYPVRMAVEAYYTASPGDTYGDVFRKGRNVYLSNPTAYVEAGHSLKSVAENTLSYNLAGDPMLPLHLPSGSVVVEEIDNKTYDDGLILEPLASHHFSGSVRNADGEVDEAFNGELTMLVYDGPHSEATTYTADDYNPPLQVYLDESLLQEVKMPVVNGCFAGDVTVAMPTYVGLAANRITLHALDNATARFAVGSVDGVEITQQGSADLEDAEAPVITAMYVNDGDLAESSVLPGSFTVNAHIQPGTFSLLGNSDRMGGGIGLVVDDLRKLEGVDGFMTIYTDGSAELSYPVTGIADGRHSLTLKVTDVAGNAAERTVSVNVMNVADARLVVDMPHARREAVIDIEHDLTEDATGRLVITDISGNTVFSRENVSFPFTWNLQTTSGTAVADGLYSAKAYFKAGRHYGFATDATIVVGR